MSDASALTPEALTDAKTGDWARPAAERQLAILERVAAIGLQILEALGEQARGGPQVVQGDLALAYDRVARAVRHTDMLHQRRVDWMDERKAGRAGCKAAFGAEAARLVRGAIEDQRGLDAEQTERLKTEAAERLRGEDVGELFSRPFGEAVAGICRQLGVTPDWLRLAEDCLSFEAAQAAEACGKGGAKAGRAEPEYDGPLEVQWLSDTRRSSDSS
jgi:hypothetical protein